MSQAMVNRIGPRVYVDLPRQLPFSPASDSACPLLYVGDHFPLTDVTSAINPV